MKFGVHLFATEYSMQPGELARLAEERDLESIWVPEHTHLPAAFVESDPRGQALPAYYQHSYDPLVALTAAAAATEHIKVGTGVCLVIEHDPIVLAKRIATLDQISDGRLLLGVGAGWVAAEMANHGTDYRTRFSLLRERLLAMREMWSDTPDATFAGKWVNFERIRLYPKPVQRPHPPLIMGGSGDRSLELAAEVADGWMPMIGRNDWPDVRERLLELRRRAAEKGRDPDDLEITLLGFLPGRPLIEEMEEAGVSRFVATLGANQRDKVERVMDKIAAAAAGAG